MRLRWRRSAPCGNAADRWPQWLHLGCPPSFSCTWLSSICEGCTLMRPNERLASASCTLAAGSLSADTTVQWEHFSCCRSLSASRLPLSGAPLYCLHATPVTCTSRDMVLFQKRPVETQLRGAFERCMPHGGGRDADDSPVVIHLAGSPRMQACNRGKHSSRAGGFGRHVNAPGGDRRLSHSYWAPCSRVQQGCIQSGRL